LKTDFRSTFLRDLRAINVVEHRTRIREVIGSVERARTLLEVPNLKKLRGRGNFFRIRAGDYRIGIVLEKDTVIFARCLERKEIYRFFP
jgi:mRNA interferase RelE/StbE